jgi:SAM-dependent methyltransferase
MLEKIGTTGFEAISSPDRTVLRLLQECVERCDSPVFFEVGIGIGATTIEVARLLNNRGSMFLFSRQRDVQDLTTDLGALGYSNVNGTWGSPSNTFSGYHFELAYGFSRGELPNFDLAYIDGGHVYHLDAPAACVLKELCKPGGYMVFDDWNWSLTKSHALNPQKRPATAIEYDARQIEECHVQLVCKTIMDTDSRFRFVGLEADSAIYQRLSGI